LFPLATGLLISPTGTFHLLGSKAEHATTTWRLFGRLLLVLAILVVNSETSGRGVHQHRYRAHGVRGPLQLPSRKDWKPSKRPYSHSKIAFILFVVKATCVSTTTHA